MAIQGSDQADINVTSFEQAAMLLEQGRHSRIRLSWYILGYKFFRLVNLVKQDSEMVIKKTQDGFWLKQK